jgi:4-hydroxythreonine-4-phosphate dehydrogenase
MRAPLALTMGDPAGVGPAISWLSYIARDPKDRPFYLIASEGLADAAARRLGVRADPVLISHPNEAAGAFAFGLPVLEIDGPVVQPGQPDPSSASAVIEAIRLAVSHVRDGCAAAVVTNPIAKALLYRQGFSYPGHTEYLAALSGDERVRPVMMLVGGGLRVALTTIHIPLAAVCERLSSGLIEETAAIVATALKRDFGIAEPRIALCGVNPHAGEEGALGRAEIEIINPAARQVRTRGINVSDARPGDTVFHEARSGRYDAVIAMYHDQGLIPVKTLDFWGGVNVTLGLPFLRTSPDHGVAYEAASAGSARPESLIAALQLADRMATARALSL